MRLLLTRHGQTDWNVAKKIQGRTDTELNETGIQQAETAREKLLNEKIDLIITSPLKRAKKTAEIIARGRNIPMIIDENITERSFGILEGKNKNDFDFYGFWNYELNQKYEDAETIRDFFDRIQAFLTKIKKEYSNQTVLLVSHAGVTATVRKILEGIPEGIDNCEIKEFQL